MSTKSSIKIDRRRKAGDVRLEALKIGRRLLLEGGLGALTLKAVGAALGMSHANLIHHFGSAEAFQDQLKSLMVEELTRDVTALIRKQAAGKIDVAEIVDSVFAAYASGGIGLLVAWAAITKSDGGTEELRQAIGELVGVLESLIATPEAARRARMMVILVSVLALGDSLIGDQFAQTLGSDPHEMRHLTTRILEQLRHEMD
jgi:AcrR family transcriptional regulator